MQQTKVMQTGILALALVFGMTMTACGGKAQAQSGGGGNAEAELKQAADAAKDMAGKAVSAVKGAAAGGKPAEASDFIYRLNTARTGVVITGIQEDAKFGAHLVVPAEIEGFPVVAYLAGGHGDSDAKKRNQPPLESVVIPDSITYIGPSGFSYEWDEEHGFLTDDWGRRAISAGGERMDRTPFYLQGSSFGGCNSLKTIVFPKSLKVVPSLRGLPSLQPEGITWPEALEIMQGFGNDATTEVVIPDGVKYILTGAFSCMKKLTTVTIPDSVEIIQDWAFNNCPELTTVNVSVHPISYGDSDYSNTFAECYKLSIAAQKAIKDTGYTGSFR
jgi:hypothetical protein